MSSAFLSNCYCLECEPDKFYTRAESTTSEYLDKSRFYVQESLGFQTYGYLTEDILCLEDCFYTQFYAVGSIQENNWLNQFEITNLGGILGLAYNSTGINSFWQNSTVGEPVFSI